MGANTRGTDAKVGDQEVDPFEAATVFAYLTDPDNRQLLNEPGFKTILRKAARVLNKYPEVKNLLGEDHATSCHLTDKNGVRWVVDISGTADLEDPYWLDKAAIPVPDNVKITRCEK